MIYFFTPYSFEMKLFKAYDDYMKLVSEEDWVCFLDGDTLFFENNFGHQVQEYIDKYPDTGLFTCYASRSSYQFMVPKDTQQENDSITYHRKRSKEIYTRLHLQVKEINEHIAAYLICIKKSTWLAIRSELLRVCDGANLLGVDTQISNCVLGAGLKIRLMRGIYLLHYYRLVEGRGYKGHLIDQKINVLIRTSNRELQFKRCLESVLNQTYKYYNIIVSTDDQPTAEYVKKMGINPVMVAKGKNTETETGPYNAYLNKMIEQVKGGWIFILDDDDYLADKSVFEKMVKHLTDENTIYFVKMKWPTGRVIPGDQNFSSCNIVRKDIGMPCFVWHAKHKHKASFKPIKQGDYHFISVLTGIVKKQRWIDMIVTHTGNTGAYGK